MYRWIFTVTAFHSLFSSFGEIENNLLSIIGLPLSTMFNESIQSHYGLIPDNTQLDTIKSSIAAVNFLGILVGGFLIGRLMDDLGRKFTSVYLRGILGLIASFSALLSYFWTSIELFTLSHFLSGINTTLKMVMILYVSECAPTHLRGPVALLLSTGNFVIQLLLQPLIWPTVFGNEANWVYLPALSLVLCVIHLTVASFFPQSPKHLYLNKQDRVMAERSLKFYQGYNVDTFDIFANYDKERELVGSEHLTLKQVWQNRTTRMPFIIVIICGLVPAFSALQIKSQFMQQMLIDIGFAKETATYGINVILLITTPFSFVSPYLIEKIGRRPLLLFMSMLCCIEWALLAIGQWQASSPGIGAAIGFTGMTCGHLAYKLGLLSLPPIILNEICPFASKAAVSEFLQIAPVFVGMGLALTYSPIVHNYGAIYNLPFLIISISLFCLLYVFLGETNAKRGPQPLTTSTSYGAIGGGFRRLSLRSID